MPSPTKQIPKPVPFLRDVYALNHTSFDKIIEFHTRVLFSKFPPSLMVFDYANISRVNLGNANLTNAGLTGAISQPTGEIDCIGTPIGATFTCRG